MVHFFDNIQHQLFDEKNEVAGGYGMFCGWMVSIFTFQYTAQLGIILGVWGSIFVSIAGIFISVVTGMLMVLGKRVTDDFYDKKIQPKFFKNKKDADKKNDQTNDGKAA